MLTYTTTQINFNFKVVINYHEDGKRIRTLVGVRGLRKAVNDDNLLSRLLDRAFKSREDMCICKLRRGLQVSFYRF